MKNKTALKQSQASVRFLAVAIVILAGATIKHPGRYTVIPLVIVVAYCAMDAFNVYVIKRRAKRDPRYLDQRL